MAGDVIVYHFGTKSNDLFRIDGTNLVNDIVNGRGGHDILQIGSARIKLTKPCAPCSRMEKVIGPGGYNAMRGHGGWYAEIIQPGTIKVKDALTIANAS